MHINSRAPVLPVDFGNAPVAQLLDVAGGCALPGLTDAHLHILG